MSDELEPYKTPPDMEHYWREAIGGTHYHPVKWDPRNADHPVRVKDVITRLKAGEVCPEAADVIVGLMHRQARAWNLSEFLSQLNSALHEKIDRLEQLTIKGSSEHE